MPTVKTPRITKPIRRMTVCRYAFWGVNSRTATSFPALRLAGKWLQDTGFKPGHVVDIACEKGRLTITIAKEQKYEALQERFQKEKIEIV